MTPQELAAMQAGLDPRAYYQDPYAAARAGLVDPETLPPRGATPIMPRVPQPGFGQQAAGVLQKGKDVAKRGGQAAQEFLGRYGKYAPAAVGIASVVPGVTTALSEIEAGRPTGAVAALAPAGLSAIGTGLAMVPNPIAKVAGYGLMGLGALLPGAAASGAESIRQSATGKPTKGKEGEFSTQIAMAQQMGELGATQYRTQMGTYTSALKDLSKHYSDQSYYDLQRNVPIIEKMKNSELVRQQALMNTQGQLQGMLGVLATGGALAQGAQANTAGLLGTALTSAPYAGSVLQAPQIRFG
jgi:hypothetical protein